MNAVTDKIILTYSNTSSLLNVLQPLALLAARLYVAWVFFAAGLTKLRDWESTLFLFEEEYVVPLLNPEIAAYMATIGEITLPILVVLGLASRLGAIGLGIVNLVAVISLDDIAPAAFSGHVIWGLLLMLITLWGAGKLSIDNFAKSKYLLSLKY
jgi:putative oxidoreductase